MIVSTVNHTRLWLASHAYLWCCSSLGQAQRRALIKPNLYTADSTSISKTRASAPMRQELMRSWHARGGAWQLVACLGVGLILLARSASSQSNKLPVKAIVVGQQRVICILTDVVAELRCWGTNDVGQLGQGDTINRSPPGGQLAPIQLAGPVKQVTVGWNHVCALLTNGSVQCWGWNRNGQLGLGDTRDRGVKPGQMGANLPIVNLGQGKVAVQVAAGDFHTCALLSDGNVKCFGENSYGTLGYGDDKERGDEGTMGDALPNVRLPPETKALNVSTGSGYTCVRLDDQSVTCWGINDVQQLGLAGSVTSWGDQPGQMGANLPRVNLGTGRKAIQIATTERSACALLDNQLIRCWGEPYGAPLDINTPPLSVGARGLAIDSAGSAFVQISCGSAYTVSCCVLRINGSLVCWGDNQEGQLGTSPDDKEWWSGSNSSVLFARTTNIEKVVQVSLGGGTTCAVFADASVKCWGQGTDSVKLGVSGLKPINFESSATPVLASPRPPSQSLLPTLPPTLSPSPSTGSKIGIIVGASAGGVLVVACVFCLIWRLRARRTRDAGKPTIEVSPWLALAPATTQAPSPSATSDPQLQDGYTWVLPDAIPKKCSYLQAGVNDSKLDTAQQGLALEGWACPVQVLSSCEVKEQIKLLAGQPLGTGAFGQVYKCTWQQRFPGALLAIKVMRRYTPVNMKSFCYEAQLLSAVRHPNILRVYGYCLEPPSVCIITELLQCSLDDTLTSVIASSHSGKSFLRTTNPPGFSSHDTVEQQQTTESDVQVTVHTSGGDVKPVQPAESTPPTLSPPVRAPNAFNMQSVLRIMLDVATGLEYLHGMCVPVNISQPDELKPLEEHHSAADAPSHTGVLHRDLKPANILLNQHGQAKLCDFGIARRLENTRVNTEVEWAGTVSYMAPELLAVRNNRAMKGMVTRKVDIYSLGIIMCELMCHSRAWLRAEQVLSGVRLWLPTVEDPEWRADCLASMQCIPEVLDKMIELISACWHHLHDKRPTAAQVKAQLEELLASVG